MKKETKVVVKNQIAVKHQSAGFYVADKEGNISMASDSLAKLLRYARKDEVQGLNWADNLYENKSDRTEFLEQLKLNGFVSDYKVKLKGKNGFRIVLSANSTLLCDENGEPIGVEGVLNEVKDIEDAKPAERAIPDIVEMDQGRAASFDSVIKDPLTQLYNYSYFMNCLSMETQRVARIFQPTCLMMIDLDNFSQFNVKYGREKGDELLKKVAGVLKKTLRSSDVLARQTQDQFLVLLPETKRDEGLAVAKMVKEAIKSECKEEKITCSIGMSRFILGMSVQEFFLQANVGMYMAKESGKNEACLYG